MVTRLAPDIHWIDLRGTNAYLVDDGGALTLVDTGMPWHRASVAAAISSVGGSIGAVERVLITHFDIDHVGGLNRLDGLDATVYASPQTAKFLTRESRPPLDGHRGVMQRLFDVGRRAPSLPIESIDDGETVGSFTAYHTPGHTPGHTVFVSEERSVALLGDLVRESGGRLEPSGWLLSHDVSQVRESLTSLVERAPEFDIACPGHGTPFTSEGSRRLAEAARGEA